MLSRPRFVGLLLVLYLLCGLVPNSRAQEGDGSLLLEGWSRPFLDEESPSPAAGLSTARPLSPWYVDVETALLGNVAIQVNDELYRVESDHALYLSPRLFVGYRFESGHSVRLTVRDLVEVGNLRRSSSLGGGGPSGSTFSVNWFDLDWVTREMAPLDGWRLQAEAGCRVVFRYQQWCYEDPFQRYRSRHTYFGAGPHLGLSSRLLLGDSGWDLYGRADGAVTFGGGESRFDYELRQLHLTGLVVPPFRHRDGHGEIQFDLSVQLGLMKRWEGDRCGFGLGFGVQAEVLSWGNLEDRNFGTLGLVNVGPFARCEVDF